MCIVHEGKMRAIHFILATAAFLVENSESSSRHRGFRTSYQGPSYVVRWPKYTAEDYLNMIERQRLATKSAGIPQSTTRGGTGKGGLRKHVLGL
jgi:hypothetical protein